MYYNIYHIFIYMKMSQGNTLYSYLKQTKYHIFYKNGQLEGRTDPVWGIGTSGRGEDMGRGLIWCKYCIHMEK
jgi:hypothetical protein